MDKLTFAERFPRSAKYSPEWVTASASGGANSLWLTEWLCAALNLKPGMRVLDLACGRAASSIFLHREFGVEVWAVDLWFNPSENQQRIGDAGVEQSVFPLRVDARTLPFAPGFFDAVISIDSFMYFGTDDLYLGYLARFLKPGGVIAIALSGLTQEIPGPVPDYLHGWWEPSMCCLHSADWWRRHWERTGIVEVQLAEAMEEGWEAWLEWQRTHYPDNLTEINALEADRGKYLGYVRVVASLRSDVRLDEPMVSIPAEYIRKPLLNEPRPEIARVQSQTDPSV
jgi:cyclopropane fatty-acyl-phospholipid synthase-like methyltransferase